MSAHNPLDEALGGDVLNENDGVSKTDALNQYMASLGFSPKKPLASDTMEYAKTYSDPAGRIGRTVIVVKKDAVGLEPTELAYATVTIQINIQANDDEIRSKAPGFCKTDILRISAHLTTASNRSEADSLECGFCGQLTAEHKLVEGKQSCLDCAKRKGF